ncbi:hypothetical protein BGZ46_004691 [Entomortierella lignicola]|nr:hypothetical protein BGZ46_004691 [Entomortierella lignicola]
MTDPAFPLKDPDPPGTTQVPEHDRSELFNLKDPIVLPTKDFKEVVWPLISNVWTQYDHYKSVTGETSYIYACRMTKIRKSSTRKDDVPAKRRRVTSTRKPLDCKIKIRITHNSNSETTRIDRCKDTPDHCHELDINDRVKLPLVVKKLIANEASKAYKPPAIVTAIEEMVAEQGLEDLNKYISRTNMANIQATLRASQLAILIEMQDLEEDIQKAIDKLLEKDYKIERFAIYEGPAQDKAYEGFCFTDEWQLERLGQSGWLTLIGSTHNTNRHGWRLFALYIRDNYGAWCIGAHFFVSAEDQRTVTKALKIIRRFQPRWEPRYMLCDQSSVENRSINLAFPGIKKGKQNCDVILCTVHVMRTWMQKIYHEDTFNIMIQAMHKTTRIGCEELIQKAIKDCPVKNVTDYIFRNYSKNTEKWALWARQHSSLLLQVTNTNPLESYHSELKRATSRTHGLFSASLKIIEVDKKMRAVSQKDAFNFSAKSIAIAGLGGDILSQIQKFPYPIQKSMATEANRMMERIENGKLPPNLQTVECHCRFFRRYMLPCKHMLHQLCFGPNKFLTSEVWIAFQRIFQENGLSVYEKRQVVEIPTVQPTEEDVATETRRLKVNELMERVRDRFWEVEEKGNVEASTIVIL